MIKLIEQTTYIIDEFEITVNGLDCDILEKILPICSAMDIKVKSKVLEVAADDVLSSAIVKTKSAEKLTKPELFKLAEFGNTNDTNFSLEECKNLVAAFMPCIVQVKTADKDVTTDYREALISSPRHLKAISNVIYSEYKAATEVSETRKK